MPYTIHKIDGCFQVFNADTGKIHAKCTTKAKAQAQVRVLESIPEKKTTPTSKLSWRDFFVLHTKGKKIPDMPAHMKQLSILYKAL